MSATEQVPVLGSSSAKALGLPNANGAAAPSAPPQALRRVVAKNIAWNWAGRGLDAVVGFVIAPFLIHHLGDTTYGLWIVIGSLCGYFGLLDFGVRGSVGRFVAFHRARGDQNAINATISTAMVILSTIGLIALISIIPLELALPHLFTVPADQLVPARWALALVYISLAFSWPLEVSEALLWGWQRFDWLNGINIFSGVVRAGLTFWLIAQGYGLVTLAWITLIGVLANGCAKAVVCVCLDRRLRVRWSLVGWDVVREIFGYGVWRSLWSAADIIQSWVSPLIIGACMSMAMVTPYAVVNKLLSIVSQVLVSARAALTPVATTFHAQSKQARQAALFIQGGKLCTAVSIYFVVGFLCLGGPLLSLWISPRMAWAGSLLSVLALGELLPLSQTATSSMILAMARHRLLSGLILAEKIIAIALSLLLIFRFGLLGMCIGLAVPAALCRGVGQMVYGCHLAEVSLWRYFRRAVVPCLLWLVIPAAGLALAAYYRPPETWLMFLLYGTVYSAATAVAMACLDWERISPMFVSRRKWFRRRGSSDMARVEGEASAP